MDDQKPTAWFIMQCWGCNKMESHPYTDHEDMERTTKLCEQRGWRRRTFGNCAAASPWFCSEDCALHSYNAVRAEEWWANKEYQRQDAKFRFGFLGVFAGVIMLGMFCLSMGWCN